MRLSLFALFFILHEGASLFFILQEKDYRCFFEDYQEDVVVKVQFNATVHQTSSHIGLFVTVVDPHRHLLLRKEYASKSTISFRTSESGEYQLCANLDSKKYAKDTVLVHFRFDAEYDRADGLVGKYIKKRSKSRKKSDETKTDGDNDNEEKQEDSDDFSFESRLKAVKEDLKWIGEMQDYSKSAEEHFRAIAETTNSRVLIWATVQLFLLLLTGWWQMRSLKTFFIKKKLV